MARPIIKQIQPFDAEQNFEVEILWAGNRPHANRIIIRDNETNDIKFDDTISTFALKHTIPSNTLENGKSWVAEIQVYDEENIPSPLSEKVLFYTFQKPDFEFIDVPKNGNITNSSFAVSVFYYSPDWEDISSYIFYLYDSAKQQISQSNTLSDSFNVAYTYTGLENNTSYYIRCKGVTVHGMKLDTGYIQINVKYQNTKMYSRIYTDTVPEKGYVKISSNLIRIEYNGDETFDYENNMIKLIDKTLYYDEGFIIDGNFTLIINGKNLWQTNDIIKMNNNTPGLVLSSRIYSNGKLRFRLLVPNSVNHYLLYSDELDFTNNDKVTIVLRRKNNLYQIKTFINGKG